MDRINSYDVARITGVSDLEMGKVRIVDFSDNGRRAVALVEYVENLRFKTRVVVYPASLVNPDAILYQHERPGGLGDQLSLASHYSLNDCMSSMASAHSIIWAGFFCFNKANTNEHTTRDRHVLTVFLKRKYEGILRFVVWDLQTGIPVFWTDTLTPVCGFDEYAQENEMFEGDPTNPVNPEKVWSMSCLAINTSRSGNRVMAWWDVHTFSPCGCSVFELPNDEPYALELGRSLMGKGVRHRRLLLVEQSHSGRYVAINVQVPARHGITYEADVHIFINQTAEERLAEVPHGYYRSILWVQNGWDEKPQRNPLTYCRGRFVPLQNRLAVLAGGIIYIYSPTSENQTQVSWVAERSPLVWTIERSIYFNADSHHIDTYEGALSMIMDPRGEYLLVWTRYHMEYISLNDRGRHGRLKFENPDTQSLQRFSLPVPKVPGLFIVPQNVGIGVAIPGLGFTPNTFFLLRKSPWAAGLTDKMILLLCISLWSRKKEGSEKDLSSVVASLTQDLWLYIFSFLLPQWQVDHQVEVYIK